ncbi:MAG: hypothetical protein WC683_04170 [bacterium]
MKIDIVPGAEPGTYTLIVDGAPRVSSESMTVCDNIKAALLGPTGCTEAREVADVIRKHLPRSIWAG